MTVTQRQVVIIRGDKIFVCVIFVVEGTHEISAYTVYDHTTFNSDILRMATVVSLNGWAPLTASQTVVGGRGTVNITKPDALTA